MTTVQIGDNCIDILGFAFDGCHKIYVLRNQAELAELIELGYDIYEPQELPDAWARSCGLRFISSGDLSEQYIGQGEDAAITILDDDRMGG